jgi:hypothetical protein
MRRLLMSTSAQDFSEATIRRFLLAQLSRGEQSAFERALLMTPLLEQRARLVEIALIDDYVLNRLKANDRDVFQKQFLVTTARRRKVEVSSALRQTLAVENLSQSARSSNARNPFVWPTFAWRVAFAIVFLMVLFASALVVRREPQIVEQIIPKRLRPAAVVTPTPSAAHHPANSSESRDHRDETPQLPAHEAAPQTMVLLASSSPDTAPSINLPTGERDIVRLQLRIEDGKPRIFRAELLSIDGQPVFTAESLISNQSDASRIDFDVPSRLLKQGEYQVKVKPAGEGSMEELRSYYFRAR